MLPDPSNANDSEHMTLLPSFAPSEMVERSPAASGDCLTSAAELLERVLSYDDRSTGKEHHGNLTASTFNARMLLDVAVSCLASEVPIQSPGKLTPHLYSVKSLTSISPSGRIQLVAHKFP